MSATETLSVTLPVETLRSIRTAVAAGEHRSESEAIAVVLQRWQAARHWQADLDAAIERGLADVAAGRVSTVDEVKDALTERFGWQFAK